MILKYVKNRIHTAKFMKKVTEIIKITSVSSFKRYEKLFLSSKQYLHSIKCSIFSMYFYYDNFIHFLFKNQNLSSGILLLILGTDKALCGSFNSRVINKAVPCISDDTKLFCIGNKVYQSMRIKYKKNIVKHTPLFPKKKKISIDKLHTLTKQIYEILYKYSISTCEIVYTEFCLAMHYKIKKMRLLPIETPIIKYNTNPQFFEVDNNLELFAGIMVKKYLNAAIFNIYCSSIASENASRMIAMEAATKNAKQRLQELNLMYNKSRQSTITKELMEVVSGSEGVK